MKRFKMFSSRKVLVMAALLVILVLVATPVLAAEFLGEDVVVVGPDEVIEDDLYAAGGTVTVDGTVEGDLVVVGGEIVVNGTVEGDLIAAGGAITVTGTIKDDARIAGGLLILTASGQVGDDVIAAGYSFEAAKGSAIGGTLSVAGYQASLAGDIKENVLGGLAALKIAGHVGGDVEVEVGEEDPEFESTRRLVERFTPAPMMPPGLTLTDEAQIDGRLSYTSGAKANVASGAEVSGGVTQHLPAVPPEEVAEKEEVSPGQTILAWFLDKLRLLVTLLVVGFLMIWLLPNLVRKTTTALQDKPLPSLLWGIVVILLVFGVIVAVLIVMVILDIILGALGLGGLVASVTGVGLVGATALLVIYLIVVSYVTKVVVSFLVAKLILKGVQPAWAEGRVWPMVIGVVLFVIVIAVIGLIPGVGPFLAWLISLLVALLGLGTIWLVGRTAYFQRREVAA
jgi:hypothetical protein